ncbi:MAG: UbiA family prenyltransferase [Actinomycetota bacterium]
MNERHNVPSDASTPVALLQRVIGFARATHFGPTLVVTAATTALAIAAGRGAGSAWVFAAVLAGQCAVGWSNDAIDADRDQKVRRSSKPVVAGLVTQRELIIAAITAFGCSRPLSFASCWRAALVHLVAIISAVCYNLWLKSTWVSWLPYALSFGLLPAFVTLGLPSRQWPQPLVMVATALLGVGAHMVNAAADLDDDAATGIKGLPQRLGARRALELGSGFLLAAAVLVGLHSKRHGVAFGLVAIIALVDLGVVVAGAKQRPRLAWNLAMAGAAGCLAVFIAGGGGLVQ